MASVKKLYIDSRFGEGTGSQFTYELPETITTTSDCVAWITDVSVPIAWHTIDVHNDKLYLIEDDGSGIPRARTVSLPTQDYVATSLVSALQTALNTNGAGPAQKHVTGSYSVSFDPQKFSLTVSLTGGGAFYVFFIRSATRQPLQKCNLAVFCHGVPFAHCLGWYADGFLLRSSQPQDGQRGSAH